MWGGLVGEVGKKGDEGGPAIEYCPFAPLPPRPKKHKTTRLAPLSFPPYQMTYLAVDGEGRAREPPGEADDVIDHGVGRRVAPRARPDVGGGDEVAIRWWLGRGGGVSKHASRLIRAAHGFWYFMYYGGVQM